MSLDNNPIPFLPARWNPRYYINRLNPFGKPTDCPFPPNYLPSDRFWLIDVISTTSLGLPTYDETTILPFVFSPGGGAALGQVTAPIAYMAELKRTGSFASAARNSYFIAMQSPRIGYSIGNRFKHQAYLKFNIMAVGFIYTYVRIAWLQAEVVTRIEYRMNCRFKRFYLKQGRVVSFRSETSKDASGNETTKYFVVLFESSSKPPSGFSPGGTVTVYKEDGTSQQLTISSVSSSWEAEVALPSGETTPKVNQGDFFVLSEPWLLENPQTMFEYELSVEDSIYETHAQKIATEPKIVGVWLPPDPESDDEDKKQFFTPYVETDFESLFKNRYNYPLKNDDIYDAWTIGYGSSPEIAGTLSDGYSAFNTLDPRPDTVRIIMDGGGGKTRQNYCAGNLQGEFLEANGNFYEILEHPSGETITINNRCLTKDDKFFTDEQPESVKIFQQNAWKISEIYYGDIEFQFGLWRGDITSVSKTNATNDSPSETTVAWNPEDFDLSSTQLDPKEEEESKCKTLTERLRKKVSLSGSTAAEAYNQFGGWRIVNVKNNETYSVKSLEFNEDTKTITAKFEGDISTVFSAGNKVEVVLDDPYNPAFSALPRASNFSYTIGTAPQLGSDGRYQLFLDGWYDTGQYKLNGVIGADTKCSIVDWMFGVDTQQSPLGVPGLLISTKKRLNAISFVEHGPSDRQCLFFADNILDILVFRTSYQNWTDMIQQRAVILGEQKVVNEGEDAPEPGYIVTQATFDFTGYTSVDSNNKLKTFWYYVPENTVDEPTPYFSMTINGGGGVKTSLSEKYDVSVESSSSSPVSIPFEHYAPIDSGALTKDGTAAASMKVSIPVYHKYKADQVWDASLEEISVGDKMKSLLDGNEVAASTTLSPKSLRFTKNSNTLRSINIFDPHSLTDTTMLLIYGLDSPTFKPLGGSSTTNNSPKPSIFALFSPDSGETWLSPKYQYKSVPTSDPDKTERQLPMMIVYDFRYAGSLIDLKSGEILIFGYAYTRDGDTSKDGNQKHLFLGVYRFSMHSLLRDNTNEMKATGEAGEGYQKDETFAYYRHPRISDGEENEDYHKMEDWGESLVGDSFENDYGTPYAEKFTKIVGGENSKAQIIDGMTISEDVIGISRDKQGKILLFVRDESNETIVCIESDDAGYNWKIKKESEEDDAENLIFASGGSSPHYHRDYLFFFTGDTLRCKRLNREVEGKHDNIQELMDAYPSTVVAVDAPPQRIAVNADKTGTVIVFYATEAGYVTAKVSYDGGLTWATKKNW